MDRNLLNIHKDDPSWAEVIRLYSGLFDTQDEREDFIIDLAHTDVLLATECKTSSLNEERVLTKQLIEDAERKVGIFQDTNKSSKAILSLLEFNQYAKIISILMNINTAKKEHRDVCNYPAVLRQGIWTKSEMAA